MKYRDFAPAMKYGAKIMPEDIAGMIGLPYVGNIFYVDPTAGNDTTNSGTSQNNALATVAAAYAKCVSGMQDVVIVAPTGGTGRTNEAAAIVWAKRFTHLIGSAAPTAYDPRAGIEFASTVVSPCFTLSENGCIFKNITISTVQNINVLVNITGSYNYFGNVHFAGPANATAYTSTARRSLVLTGASENLFEDCIIGVETVASTVAGANLEQTGTCRRNTYRHCTFPVYDTAGTSYFIKADTGNCTEMSTVWEDCIFTNPLLIGSTTIMAVAMKTELATGGIYYLINPKFYGVTAVASVLTHVMTFQAAPDTAGPGFMVVAG